MNTTIVVDTTECPVASTEDVLYSGYKGKETLKYEVGVAIGTGRFVWAPTPGLLGPDSDQFCYRFFGLTSRLRAFELVLGDSHYIGESHSYVKSSSEYTKLVKRVRVIIENAINRLKKWNVLVLPWRHAVEIHHVVFTLVVHIANIEMENNPIRTLPHPALWDPHFWEIM